MMKKTEAFASYIDDEMIYTTPRVSRYGYPTPLGASLPGTLFGLSNLTQHLSILTAYARFQ